MEEAHSLPLLASFIVISTVSAALILLRRRNIRLPPGPTPWPILGNLLALGALPHRSLAKLAERYGPLMTLRLGSVCCVVVTSSKYAEEFLKVHDLVWCSRPATSQGELVCFRSSDISTAPYGTGWKLSRMIFMSELLTAQRLADFQEMRRRQILFAVRELLRDCDDGQAVNMDARLHRLNLNIATRMLVDGGSVGERAKAMLESDEHLQLIKEVFDLCGVFNIGDCIPWLNPFDLQGYIKRMKACGKRLEEVMDLMIDECRKRPSALESGRARDVMDVMLSRPKGRDGENLTDDQMKGIMEDMLFGGTDTSATTMEWCLSELLKNPSVLVKIQAELDSVVGRERLANESDVPNLPYLQAVVKETFRLHPVATLLPPRESIKDCTIAGYHFPAKTRLFVNAYAIHRDPAVWDRPLDFYPERFLGLTKDVHGHDYDFLPFGSGRRVCPGKTMGLIAVHHVLAVLLHACDWSLPAGMKPEDLDMMEAFGLTCPRKEPLKAVAVPRLSEQVIFSEISF